MVKNALAPGDRDRAKGTICHDRRVKFPGFSRTFNVLSFFQDFSRPENLFFHFPGFPGAWEPFQ